MQLLEGTCGMFIFCFSFAKQISFCKCQKAKGHHVRMDSEGGGLASQ
jgi:hypothetical protein